MSFSPFRFTAEVTAATAKQDHLHVTFGDWKITGTTEEIDALRERMAAPPMHARNGDPHTVMEIWGALFKRPQQHEDSRPPLGVRKETLCIGCQMIPPPLFSGNWTFKNYVQNPNARKSTTTRLKLHLNPTRFLRYQPLVLRPDPAAEITWPEPLLFAETGPTEVDGEIVLNNDDNWFPQTREWERFSSPLRWRRYLRAYLDAIPLLLEAELDRTRQHPPHITWSRPKENLVLHSSETYWEFFSENPTALVASIKPLLDSFTARHREATSYRQDCDPSIDHNALSLYAEINPGRAIRIYAKTNRRVRIEVLHRFGGEGGYRIDGGHTADEWRVLPEMLEQLAQDSAELINRMFVHFRSLNDVASVQIAPYDFLMEITHHARDLSIAQAIAAELIHNGNLAAGGAGSKMQKALHRLSDAGILKHNQKTGIYVVSATRSDTLKTLREKVSFTLLTTRIRRRNPQT